MIIDAWMQHPTPLLLQQSMFDSLRRWVGEIPMQIPLEATLKAMDQAGVSRALLSSWEGPMGTLISNEDVAACVKAHPDRFAGVASVPLLEPVKAVRTLRRQVKEQGFKALRVIQWLWERPCTDPLYYPLLTECVELGVPICLQVGLTGPLKTSQTGRPHHIERIALDFPDLDIVCGHLGYPWQGEMIAYATKFPNVYIDTSAYKCSRYPADMVAYMKGHGRHKVMFGSNYPMITPADCLASLDQLGLDDEARQLFLHDNAKRVFQLED